MTPRFMSFLQARDFADYAENVSGASMNVFKVRNAWLVRPQGEVALFWRIANAWGYLFAKRVPDDRM